MLTACARSEARNQSRQQATTLAAQLGCGAVRAADGSWKIPIALVTQLALCGGFTHVAFEGIGTVDLRILKQVLRTCRSVRLDQRGAV